MIAIDICTIKTFPYNEKDKYKLIFVPLLQWLKDDKMRIKKEDFKSYDHKLENSLSRAKSTIAELALCNPWEYFVTLTIDKEKADRYDLESYIKSLTQWLGNAYRGDSKLSYLLIPELHLDGAVHVHGLVNGLSLDDLRKFEEGMYIPKRLIKKIDSGADIFSWVKYSEKFGFSVIEKVKNSTAISYYLMKYVSKNPAVTEKFKRIFYASLGLKKAEKVKLVVESADTVNCDISRYARYSFCNIAYTDDISGISMDDICLTDLEKEIDKKKELEKRKKENENKSKVVKYNQIKIDENNS